MARDYRALLIAAMVMTPWMAKYGHAEGAVPKPDITVHCKTGTRHAKVWFTPYSAKNPCPRGQWLSVFTSPNDPNEPSQDYAVDYFSPGSYFTGTANLNPAETYVSASVGKNDSHNPALCGDPYGLVRVYKNGVWTTISC